jgi:hypothetical protein
VRRDESAKSRPRILQPRQDQSVRMNLAKRKVRARIDLDGGIYCQVLNLSGMKATIEVALPFRLPIEFDIVLEGENNKRYCAIAWRNHRRVGVYFV